MAFEFVTQSRNYITLCENFSTFNKIKKNKLGVGSMFSGLKNINCQIETLIKKNTKKNCSFTDPQRNSETNFPTNSQITSIWTCSANSP